MRRLPILTVTLLALLALPAGAHARAGVLDPGFGRHGVALLGRAGTSLTGEGVALQGDGRVTVAGSDRRGFVVARLRASGAPDPSFGHHGRTMVRFRGATAGGARAVTLFRDGRILVAGTVTIGGKRRFGVARLLPGGR